MGRRPYVQAHRRRHRTPIAAATPPPMPLPSPIVVTVTDDRNPVSSVLSPVCSREEKDSSLPYHSQPSTTPGPLESHQLLLSSSSSSSSNARNISNLSHLFASTRAFSSLTHRVALTMLQTKPILQARSTLLHHIKSIMALLQPIMAPTTRHKDDKLISRVVAASTTPARRRLTLPERIPRGAWDSHMHVVDPAAYPLAKDAVYCPKTHRLDHALAFESSVGIDNIVLVQPSIYGNDNTCLLDALRALGSRRGRAVVAFEPGSLSQSTLAEWHRLGVRGVRINLSSVGKSLNAVELDSLLRRYAHDCKPLDWVMQVYMPMSMIELLEPIVPTLGVRVCIDHLGHPNIKDMPSHNPYDMKGFKSLAKLLRAGNTYVKLSAPYRLSSKADHSDLEPIAREVLHLRGKDRVIFATDWPHTRFEGLDIRPWMETVLDWCGKDDVLVDRLFMGNAEDLWNARHSR
ncbi:amidohydrolase [Colletotrichum filicis]|nr:amidohydrolase [Colletotrichum filicis]